MFHICLDHIEYVWLPAPNTLNSSSDIHNPKDVSLKDIYMAEKRISKFNFFIKYFDFIVIFT